MPFELAGVVSGDRTRGHRFMAPEPFAVRDFADYVVKLRDAKVILDGAERRAIIARRAAELAEGAGLGARRRPGPARRAKGLVEWPVPLLAGIDEGFMALPPEALVATMRTNQKYLALRTHEGGLARRFVLVANMEASDGGAAIVAGNERVLRARLWDARFFWEQDRKVSLESRLPDLDRMVFHAELGSQGQRVERLVALSGALVPFVPGADRTLAERAALLAKADLVTGMVGEFPELQGIMGGYYARAQGEPAEVATAIRDHYAPKGPDDACPSAPESVVVALADKLDMLAGFFGAGIRPTGSKDPFALRRAGLGIIRLIVDNGLRLPLQGAFAAALAGYGDRFQGVAASDLGQELTAFLADRLKVHLRERGVRHDVVAAAFAVGVEDDLVRLIARAEALQAFLDSEDGRNLAYGLSAREQHRRHRGEEGRPALRGSAGRGRAGRSSRGDLVCRAGDGWTLHRGCTGDGGLRRGDGGLGSPAGAGRPVLRQRDGERPRTGTPAQSLIAPVTYTVRLAAGRRFLAGGGLPATGRRGVVAGSLHGASMAVDAIDGLWHVPPYAGGAALPRASGVRRRCDHGDDDLACAATGSADGSRAEI